MNAYLLSGLETTPALFRRLIVMCPLPLDEPTEPGRFSPREVMAHLADWEPIFRGRIERALQEDEPEIEVYDEGQRAMEKDYASWPLQESLNLFEQERMETVRLLRTLQSGDELRRIMHPEQGRVTILSLGSMLLGHDVYHIEQLTKAKTNED